jgi:hypothetical protein
VHPDQVVSAGCAQVVLALIENDQFGSSNLTSLACAD